MNYSKVCPVTGEDCYQPFTCAPDCAMATHGAAGYKVTDVWDKAYYIRALERQIAEQLEAPKERIESGFKIFLFCVLWTLVTTSLALVVGLTANWASPYFL